MTEYVGELSWGMWPGDLDPGPHLPTTTQSAWQHSTLSRDPSLIIRIKHDPDKYVILDQGLIEQHFTSNDIKEAS